MKKYNIDFLGKKWYFIGLSVALMLLSIAVMAIKGIPYGIDFAGGTEVIVKCREARGSDQIRVILHDSGFPDAVIQTYGNPADNLFLIRIQNASTTELTESEKPAEETTAVAAQILAGLRQRDPVSESEGKSFDVNAASPEEWARFLDGAVPGKGAELSTTIRVWLLANGGIFRSVVDVGSIPGVPPEVGSAVQTGGYAGNFVQLKADVVGPTVGHELRLRAIYAVFWSLLGILAYVWFRFELNFGVGAVLCLFHDVLIALGALALAGVPLDTTCVAALLTIVGYSVNDTVVIFDRVRENLRSMRSADYETVFNTSMNQTLGRTILTSGLTLITVLSLLIFGGPVLFGFSLALTVGIITGTYSSIYIAAPIAIFWHRYSEKWKAQREQGRRGKKKAQNGSRVAGTSSS